MKKALVLFFLYVAAIHPARADMTWAVAGPFTGPVASIGLSEQAGVKQAVDDINAACGINGQKIALKLYDDACDPKQAVVVANKIVSDNLRIIMHGSCSGASLAASKTYLDEGDLVINPVSSNPMITDQGGATLFRAMTRDDDMATVLANSILKHDPHLKIAVIHDKSTYGFGVADYFRAALNKGGMKEILFEPYDPANHDYSILATRLKQSGADAVFIGGYAVEAAMITRQLHEADPGIRIFAGDLSPPEYWRIANEAGEGAEFVYPSDPQKAVGAQRAITELKKTGITVDAYVLYAYAAAQVLAQAMAKAGSDPAKIAAEIHKSEFDTILGKWSFDAKGDVRNIHAVVYRWHQGRYEEVGAKN
jgi:branched-chain amino acid transport system substrate-binding protein